MVGVGMPPVGRAIGFRLVDELPVLVIPLAPLAAHRRIVGRRWPPSGRSKAPGYVQGD